MKAVTVSNAELSVGEVDLPTPERGQLVLDVVRCGICGSDLHARHHADALADIAGEIGYDGLMRSSERIVLGHEFSGIVTERGKGTRLAEGTPVVSFPLLRRGKEVHTTGLSVHAPGGYAEKVLVQDALTLEIPNGLPTDLAALTEPMAVGLHAVRRGEVGKGQVAIVIGCGPVGLSVISMLKAQGVKTVVASDFSAGRRALAKVSGADVVVDPATESPYSAANGLGHGHLTAAQDVFELGVSTVEKLRKVPVLPWHAVWRAADKVGAADPKHPVIFECVGVPGVIEEIISTAPVFSRVVVVGVCMEPDKFRPAMAINKEIDLRFVLGYTPLEFHDALMLLADGKADPEPLVTGVVGLGGVAGAFDALKDPETHAKILIDPQSAAVAPEPR
ncbi:alcohol dehydrogenase [Nocardioides marmoriginsengisoli]|uniref:Alcohol dehydrogenase n=1 Tax=Nocardioides marmoriginsengisoli TaxID=661483 RepID=A0A3N0CQK0_9ACTN|nr:zinc-binding dehydrogenase [Nocardioides marmoriginsengisoli]RNL65737.1 alcohol dehydrogenase [Nocardioides marmoriginsengisoli]